MKILIIGPIGSGKTTQGIILSKELNLPLIQTGQLIRTRAQGTEPLAAELQIDIKNGLLVSDQLMADLFKEEVQKNAGQGFISDSYPRRLSQLSVFDPGIDLVIYLLISDEVLEKRLLARQRADDTPEIIEKRLQVYHKETSPLLEHYRAQNMLLSFDSSGEPQVVAQEIIRRLHERGI